MLHQPQLERLRSKRAARRPCLECHQSFLLCVLDGIQGSRRSCGWVRTDCQGRAGLLLALRTRDMPPSPGSHGATPGPAAKQQEGRFVRVSTRSWNSRPVATHYRENNWGEIVQLPEKPGRTARALKFSSQASQEPWDRAGRHLRVTPMPGSIREAVWLCGEWEIPGPGWVDRKEG